ncbi:hypothetical protein MGG_16879 [Pyricularia oryzae 70-15]|uniref:Uncharacterized protein n=3 Tax=Pyricularia oryzae TaxID=318829 RepID=G4N504_PYRO7|nr:uncharacterized protein MGG_16879 [Pyricularia oryzae 70-15]EHA52915.1 hypothetical protein MGG_16879 [Pyricularia oryzae 70-15]ELQ39035.1 hypothetical protein OOU_Y34scaffold00516g70 [Pyricularia oryzae Y34]KAI7927708.1 hypothetical protein M0657_003110 [Pyricularia oryzae]KAI7930676.1 hypothetical protein M9X92_000740 [Pyricularia oryzae]
MMSVGRPRKRAWLCGYRCVAITKAGRDGPKLVISVMCAFPHRICRSPFHMQQRDSRRGLGSLGDRFDRWSTQL